MQDNDIESTIEYFKSPSVLYYPKELIDNPSLVPRERGIYGWYFDVLPPTIPGDRKYIEVDGYKLLYIGISGRQNNGKGDLRRRLINNHLGKHSTGSSTLRRTLGKLLADELALMKYPKGDRYWFGTDGEQSLRNWMIKHTRVAFHSAVSPSEDEELILLKLGLFLPLNKAGNINRISKFAK